MLSRFNLVRVNGPVLLVFVVFLAGCAAPASKQPQTVASDTSDADLARALSAELAASCPETSPSDLQARQRCADGLTHGSAMQGRTPQFLLWGGQSAAGSYDLTKSQTTRFDPLVLRRMYLSTFMFSNQYRIESDGNRSIMHVPVRFRNEMDPGEYPYPFWHSEKKWRSYQQTQEMLFFLQDGQVVAVLRSAELDPKRAVVSHKCTGCVQWQSDGSGLPRVALYRFMFSRANPHLAAVESAYRAFEQAQRDADCMSCHSPSNPSHMNPLELFSYPNQALTERNTIVKVLEQNHMPPKTKTTPAGIPDESYRQVLLKLAREFARSGDRAMEFESRQVSLAPR